MAALNYKHLHYFWVVAQEGSITRAAERLDVAVQTISGQLSLLNASSARPCSTVRDAAGLRRLRATLLVRHFPSGRSASTVSFKVIARRQSVRRLDCGTNPFVVQDG